MAEATGWNANSEGWSVFDADDADAGFGWNQNAGTVGAQVGGSVSIMPAPPAGEVIGDWTKGLETVTKITKGIADIATTFQNSRNSVAALKIAANDARDAQSFTQFQRAAELDLKRAEVQGKTDLGKLGLGVELVKAQASMSNAIASANNPVTRFIAGLTGAAGTPGAASAGPNLVMLVLAAAGIWLVYQQVKKR